MKRNGAHIAIEGVTHAYRRGAEAALQGIDLQIDPGECVALVGRSGCGKSTLLHLLSGLMLPSQGAVYIDGARVTGPSPQWVMMFQSPSLYPWMTVAQSVGLGLRFRGRRPDDPARVAQMLELVEMGAFAQRNVQALSGGQQQRVALARSLALEPEVLLLDEPFSALDAFTRHSLQRDVRRIAQSRRITLVFVTHDINEAVMMADRVIVLAANPGRVFSQVAIGVDGERHSADPGLVAARQALISAYESATGLEMGEAQALGVRRGRLADQGPQEAESARRAALAANR